jgi:hypothetical protein
MVEKMWTRRGQLEVTSKGAEWLNTAYLEGIVGLETWRGASHGCVAKLELQFGAKMLDLREVYEVSSLQQSRTLDAS